MGNSHHRKATRFLLTLVAAALFTPTAQAVIVRGTVTTPFGVPLGNARVQLIQGQSVAAYGFTQQDGTYEIRSSNSGHFVLLTSAAPYTPSVGQDFYGARTAVITRNIVMQYTTVSSDQAVIATGIPTPIQQLPTVVTLIPQSALATQIGIVNDLRQATGTNVVQTGQAGGPVALYIRGGSPDANKVLTDGVPSTDIGGDFNYGPVSTTALTGPELYRGANSALFGTGAEAGTVNLATTRSNSSSVLPSLIYTGDAGNFYTYRNEAVVSGAFKRLDYLTAFSRFNTSNALPRDQYHSTNEAANIGYSIVTNTRLRYTLRNTDSATGLPSAHDIYGISSSGKQADQDIYSGLTIENVVKGNWHNLARYGIARKREQVEQFTPTGLPVTTIVNGAPQTTYYGNPVAFHGANGYTATGQAAFILPAYDSVSNRDVLDYQSDYTFPKRIAVPSAFSTNTSAAASSTPPHPPTESSNEATTSTPSRFRATSNIASSIPPEEDRKQRTLRHLGNPRIGLTYDAVRPGHRLFRGTLLRANVATGIQNHPPSPSSPVCPLAFSKPATPPASLSSTSRLSQPSARVPTTSASTRTSSTRNSSSRPATFTASSTISSSSLAPTASNTTSTSLQTSQRRFLRRHSTPSPTVLRASRPISIPALQSPLSPWRLHLSRLARRAIPLERRRHPRERHSNHQPQPPRHPHRSALAPRRQPSLRSSSQHRLLRLRIISNRFSTAIKGAFTSRSDDSTFQFNNDSNGGNALLLPNRDLDFGYTKLDLNVLFVATHRITVFTQLDNLLGQQHMGPIGYPGLPLRSALA